mmetsp:Transcript_168663/g.536326  ORF Transcript_168663/g.536326 Transcript_168663/m.536326 type:complete len:315 (+) Transcript_168663:1873-2817(+)
MCRRDSRFGSGVLGRGSAVLWLASATGDASGQTHFGQRVRRLLTRTLDSDRGSIWSRQNQLAVGARRARRRPSCAAQRRGAAGRPARLADGVAAVRRGGRPGGPPLAWAHRSGDPSLLCISAIAPHRCGESGPTSARTRGCIGLERLPLYACGHTGHGRHQRWRAQASERLDGLPGRPRSSAARRADHRPGRPGGAAARAAAEEPRPRAGADGRLHGAPASRRLASALQPHLAAWAWGSHALGGASGRPQGQPPCLWRAAATVGESVGLRHGPRFRCRFGRHAPRHVGGGGVRQGRSRGSGHNCGNRRVDHFAR